MEQLIARTLADVQRNLTSLQDDDEALAAINDAAQRLSTAFSEGGKVYAAGNGGSLCDAMHFAEELSGSFRHERAALPAIAIADAAHLTCVGNDFGFERVFARYVEAHARQGDAFVAISTSGSSRNVVLAAQAARERDATVIALTGRRNSALADLADVEICTPVGEHSDRVQELHIVVLHMLVELIERALFPENYEA